MQVPKTVTKKKYLHFASDIKRLSYFSDWKRKLERKKRTCMPRASSFSNSIALAWKYRLRVDNTKTGIGK